MAAIGEKEIKALIRSGDIGGAFLLFGTESYLKEFYSSKLKDKAVSPDFADFNYHFFDGASCTLEDIEQAVEAFPMMSSNTCVFVKDMAVDSLDEDSYEKLEKIVGDVPDYCTLIFYIGKADSLKKTGICRGTRGNPRGHRPDVCQDYRSECIRPDKIYNLG